ncbi:MAG: hypothetical protein U1E13_06380, partial [Methylophilaceae bacterium]|nr:hypothetical protein [Methylophilaceae bacterium]
MSLFLFGCSTYMQNAVYRPAPATYQEWSKPRTSSLEVKKSLLECDKPAPDTSFEIYEKAFNLSRYDEVKYINKLLLEGMCMEQAGYTYNGTYNTSKICSLEKYKLIPACHPDAIISTPSVERRLNSWYCKVKSDYNYCLEHALAPQLCTPEKANNPPPECLADGQSSLTTVSDKSKILVPESPENQEYNRRKFEQQQLQ